MHLMPYLWNIQDVLHVLRFIDNASAICSFIQKFSVFIQPRQKLKEHQDWDACVISPKQHDKCNGCDLDENLQFSHAIPLENKWFWIELNWNDFIAIVIE